MHAVGIVHMSLSWLRSDLKLESTTSKYKGYILNYVYIYF